MNQKQIKDMVKILLQELEKRKEAGQTDPDLNLNNIRKLFESMFTDLEMSNFSDLLVKQFAEKEILQKLLLSKYLELKRMEKSSIKDVFNQKLKDLDAKRAEIGEDKYERVF